MEALAESFGIPVHAVGLGDLRSFDAAEFAKRLTRRTGERWASNACDRLAGMRHLLSAQWHDVAHGATVAPGRVGVHARFASRR
jgi:hypothetical protein